MPPVRRPVLLHFKFEISVTVKSMLGTRNWTTLLLVLCPISPPAAAVPSSARNLYRRIQNLSTSHLHSNWKTTNPYPLYTYLFFLHFFDIFAYCFSCTGTSGMGASMAAGYDNYSAGLSASYSRSKIFFYYYNFYLHSKTESYMTFYTFDI